LRGAPFGRQLPAIALAALSAKMGRLSHYLLLLSLSILQTFFIFLLDNNNQDIIK
jgi:hypothetical protein